MNGARDRMLNVHQRAGFHAGIILAATKLTYYRLTRYGVAAVREGWHDVWRGAQDLGSYMAVALDKSEVLARELNALPGSFIAGVRFDLRWDSAKFSEFCQALHAATKQHIGSSDLPRDLSQLFWYAGTFIPMWIQQRDFTVGQSHVNYEKACRLLKRLGDAWFCEDGLLSDDELASNLKAI